MVVVLRRTRTGMLERKNNMCDKKKCVEENGK